MDYIRLLQCLDCKTLEQLPDYDGEPRRDVLLARLLEPHRFPTGEEHRGHLHRVESQHWADSEKRTQIEARIRAASGHTGLDTAFYATKDTFTEDALRCFRDHLRNPGCGDYKSDSKRLTPGTARERKEAGLPTYRSHKDKYLCEFCPVHSLVTRAAADKAGLT